MKNVILKVQWDDKWEELQVHDFSLGQTFEK